MRKRMNERKRALRELATKFLMLLVFLGIVFGVVFGIMPMRNQDMMPKISAGDLMVYERLGKFLDERGRGGLEKGREDLYRTDRRGSGGSGEDYGRRKSGNQWKCCGRIQYFL